MLSAPGARSTQHAEAARKAADALTDESTRPPATARPAARTTGPLPNHARHDPSP